jgi:hypothetical protein
VEYCRRVEFLKWLPDYIYGVLADYTELSSHYKVIKSIGRTQKKKEKEWKPIMKE